MDKFNAFGFSTVPHILCELGAAKRLGALDKYWNIRQWPRHRDRGRSNRRQQSLSRHGAGRRLAIAKRRHVVDRDSR